MSQENVEVVKAGVGFPDRAGQKRYRANES
jgi:hypothetical protein